MGIFAKIKKAWFDTIVWETIDDEFYDELEDSLIMADLGATVAHDAVKKLRDVVYQKSIQRGDDVKQALRDILIEKLNVGDTALDLSTKPSVVLVIGVNGVGKTTSIGKIAHRLKGEGKRVLLCAADTFRAAAADQLEIWANRAECEIVRSVEGADPGAVLFDSLAAAKARGVDVVLCDTAGRLHNKVNLMNELSKLRKIIDRETPDAAKETLLVLDATTGQNGLQQAKVFRETAGLTGIILTKLDGTAKGGICVAIAQELSVPVKYVGLGEGRSTRRNTSRRSSDGKIINLRDNKETNMEITSVCPYCGKEMRDGAIPVLRDIYWCPRGEDGMLKDGFGDEKEQVCLGRAGLLGDYYTPARYCESCKVVIVPVPEIEWPLDKLDKKFTAWQEKMSAQREERKAQREEEKREEKSRKRREKDPWEV